MVIMGKEFQDSLELELELEERDRVKVQVRLLAMVPADKKVLALEGRVGGNQVLGDSQPIGRRIDSGNVEAASEFGYSIWSISLRAWHLLQEYPGAIMFSTSSTAFHTCLSLVDKSVYKN